VNFLKRLLGKGCTHRFSWPRVDNQGRHYQICSRCGIAYEYDWGLMRQTNRLMPAEVPIHLILTQASARPAKSL
jgi:hypothetical protein